MKNYKIFILAGIFMILLRLGCPPPGGGEGGPDNEVPQPDQIMITFPDPNLEARIRERINRPSGNIYDTQVADITSFHASSCSISDLSGMEHFHSLEYLYFSYNQISDLNPLIFLTSLADLHLYNNPIIAEDQEFLTVALSDCTINF